MKFIISEDIGFNKSNPKQVKHVYDICKNILVKKTVNINGVICDVEIEPGDNETIIHISSLFGANLFSKKYEIDYDYSIKEV